MEKFIIATKELLAICSKMSDSVLCIVLLLDALVDTAIKRKCAFVADSSEYPSGKF